MTVVNSRRRDPRFNPLEEPVPQARPRATAYALGVLLIAIIGSAIAILFVIPSRDLVFRRVDGTTFVVTHANIWLATIGLAFGLIALIFLVSGNTRRLRLIYEFTASAAELTAELAQEEFGEEDYNQKREDLRNYKNALLKLGAYEQALQVSRWITLSDGRSHYVSE
jgi:hypothetical protein